MARTIMVWRRFYWRLLCKAFIKPLLWFDMAAALLGIPLSLIWLCIPSWRNTLSPIAWAVPVAVFVACLVVGFVLSPYLLSKDEASEHARQSRLIETERDSLARRLAQLVGTWTAFSVDEQRTLNEYENKLATGLLEYDVPLPTRDILAQLSLQQIVHLEQHRVTSGSHEYDVGYWVLTDIGKQVLASRRNQL